MITETAKYPYIATDTLPIETCYEMVQPIIERTVRKFWLQYGGNLDDLLANANTAFMRAWHANRGGYRGNHKNFAYAVKRWVWALMFDEYRSNVNRAVRYGETIHDEFIDQHADNKEYKLLELLDSLGEDAKIIAGLVIDTPPELLRTICNKGGEPRNWRSTIREHLRACGWGAARVSAAFADISAAVTG